MKGLMLGFTAVTLSVFSGQCSAEPGPLGQWLMSTPTTLWDRGMDAIDDAIEKLEIEGPSDASGRRWIPMKLLGSVHYDRDKDEIVIDFVDHTYQYEATHEGCNESRSDLIYRLFGAAPPDSEHFDGFFAWAYPDEIEAGLSAQEIMAGHRIPSVVSSWFNHAGHPNGDRDKEFGEKLAQIIFVSVTIRVDDRMAFAECYDQITSFDAPSRIWGQ